MKAVSETKMKCWQALGHWLHTKWVPFLEWGDFHSWLQLLTFLCKWANQLQLKLEDCLSPISGLWKRTWPWGQRRYIARMCGPLLSCPLDCDSKLERWKIWTTGSVNKYEMKCKTEGNWLLSQGESGKSPASTVRMVTDSQVLSNYDGTEGKTA